MPIVPDTKDWTWVLNSPCSECGFDASSVDFKSIPNLTRESSERIAATLDRADATVRPSDSTWSALEYAAHVRDVCRIFAYRLEVAVAGTGTDPQVPAFDATPRSVDGVPLLSNWDQDQTADEAVYGIQEPSVVSTELVAAAEHIAGVIEGVGDADRSKIILRSDGARFTVESLAQYFLHDLMHHVHDVRG